MGIAIAIGIFLILFIFIFTFKYKRKKPKMQITINKQSETHAMLKNFFSREVKTIEKKSQVSKRVSENSIDVVVVDKEAYWISNNTFYTAQTVNNVPNMETAKPVDIFKMSKDELDKMLFILDNLGGGKNNERGSAGN